MEAAAPAAALYVRSSGFPHILSSSSCGPVLMVVVQCPAVQSHCQFGLCSNQHDLQEGLPGSGRGTWGGEKGVKVTGSSSSSSSSSRQRQQLLWDDGRVWAHEPPQSQTCCFSSVSTRDVNARQSHLLLIVQASICCSAATACMGPQHARSVADRTYAGSLHACQKKHSRV